MPATTTPGANGAGRSRANRRYKAMTLLPLAVLSGAWTMSVLTGTANASDGDATHLPDGATVPTKAIQAPASVPVSGQIAPGVPDGTSDQVISGASANGIPAPALTAYQRAAQIIDSADKTCNISWELIGAIGRVESDHGQFGGSRLNAKGIDVPGIYGPVLNGKNGTQAIHDTDAGQIDKDAVWDRAVGPMQFIPSTWEVVKVDADGDGKRDPQDINDAALATAVYLCSGKENLSTRAGQEQAVYRYNHSQSYVDLVLRLMEAYSQGDYTTTPAGAPSSTTLFPTNTPLSTRVTRPHAKKATHSTASSSGTTTTTTTTGSSGTNTTSGDKTSGTKGNSSGTGDTKPTAPTPSPNPVAPITKPVTKAVVTQAQAITMCTNALLDAYGHAPQQAVNACVPQLVGKTVDNATSTVNGVVAGLKQTVCGLLPLLCKH